MAAGKRNFSCETKHGAGGAGEHPAAEPGKVQDGPAEAGGQDLGHGRHLVRLTTFSHPSAPCFQVFGGQLLV